MCARIDFVTAKMFLAAMVIFASHEANSQQTTGSPALAQTLTEIQKLLASDAAEDDQFGSPVSSSGDTAIIGAPGDDHAGGMGAGSVYVFTRTGGVWSEQQKLTASDAAAGDQFGASVSISGDTAIVGAFWDDHAGGNNAGSAYVFTRTGGVWSQQQKLTASDAAAGDHFGGSGVSISGDTAIVGAYTDSHAGGNQAGSAYIFTRTGGIWREQQKLTASDAAANDLFGASVSISGDTAIVGAFWDDHAGGINAGSAYVFTRTGGVWSEQQKLTASDAAFDDQFGSSVSVDGDTALVGAAFDNHADEHNAGSAYVFTRTAGVWSEQQKLTASDTVGDDLFGVTVSISGDTALVGAAYDDHADEHDAGSAYVFTRAGGIWSQQQKLTASDAADGDFFGAGVSIIGDTALVGAYNDDHAGGMRAGSVYVFDLSPCPADFDASGSVNGLDLAQLLAAWGPCPRIGSCPADLDGSGIVNGFDLAMLLAAWG